MATDFDYAEMERRVMAKILMANKVEATLLSRSKRTEQCLEEHEIKLMARVRSGIASSIASEGAVAMRSFHLEACGRCRERVKGMTNTLEGFWPR